MSQNRGPDGKFIKARPSALVVWGAGAVAFQQGAVTVAAYSIPAGVAAHYVEGGVGRARRGYAKAQKAYRWVTLDRRDD